jgi:predicted ATP-dependent protease
MTAEVSLEGLVLAVGGVGTKATAAAQVCHADEKMLKH